MTDAIKVARYCELSLNPCSRTYGVDPCTASIGVTGEFKCYNSPRTCQDPPNFLEGDEQIVRWSLPTGESDLNIDDIPSITNISRRPQRLNAGESLGVRESVTVSFGNHRHNDVGFDDYLADRSGNPYNKGTFWGKFFARWGNLEGKAFRTIDGIIGQDLSEMTTRHYVVSSLAGIDSNGRVSITAKDAIKFFDKIKAQAPLPSNGTLSASITDVSTSFTLTPAGVGNLEYPASGVASIGDERMTFTRVADVVTMSNRGSSGTKAESHDAGETFQLALVYTSQDVSFILNDLITGYTSTPADYINLSEWQEEVLNYLPRLYSTEIMRPTSVRDLINELIAEVGLVFYTDVESKKLVLKAFRSLVPTTEINDSVVLENSVKSKRLSDRRVDRIWIYYGKFNPLQEMSQRKNYRSVYTESSGDPVVALENSVPSIREVLSRWINVGAATTVQDLANNMLTRYQTSPREFSFSVNDTAPVSLGEAVSIQSRVFENPEGDAGTAFNGQVVSLDNKNGFITAVAEELPEGIEAGLVRIIQLDSDTYNLNLRTIHDTLYTEASSGDTVRLLVNENVILGSTTILTPALDVGSWPAGITIEIGGLGRIQGRGGDGKIFDGGNGGDALLTGYALEIISDIEIWSGGGGGMGVEVLNLVDVYESGGGGAGTDRGFTGGSGNPNVTRQASSATSRGWVAGQTTSFGGNPGLDATGSGLGAAGIAGNAIDGVSFVTINGGASPDIRGTQVG